MAHQLTEDDVRRIIRDEAVMPKCPKCGSDLPSIALQQLFGQMVHRCPEPQTEERK